MPSGYLMRDSEHEEEGKKNGNHSNGNGNGNGSSSNGGGNGGSVSEAAVSKKQQRFFGMVRAVQKGRANIGGEVAKAAASMKEKDVKDFASTKHKNLPDKKELPEAKNGDHEIAMAQSQLSKSAKNIAKLKKALGKKEKDIPAWMQAKITDTAHDTDAAAGYVDKINEERDGKSAKDKGYSLRDWFKGGGWKQTGGKYDGKPCAKQPGQKTKPYCRDADDRAAMSKDERNRRAAKKRKEDPNPNRTGAAKIVTQDSFSNWRQEIQLDEGLFDLFNKKDQNKVRQGTYHKDDKAKQGTIFSNVSKRNEMLKKLQNQSFEPDGEVIDEGLPDPKVNYLKDMDPYDRRRQIRQLAPGSPLPPPTPGLPDMRLRKAKAKTDKKVQTAGYEMEGDLVDEGKKDACYHKVKSRYSVWPSAYASGALVKCRKVGAANWGNKTKKEEFELGESKDKLKEVSKQLAGASKMHAQQSKKVAAVADSIEEAKKCWKGYKKAGTQKLFGKTYNRCVKDHYNWRDDFVPTEYETTDLITNQDVLGEDWTKKSGKDPEGGLNEKGRRSYERENPGSDLKRPSKVVGNKRRASFCARMKGMKKKLTSAKTANDPDSRINKSLRAWNC